MNAVERRANSPGFHGSQDLLAVVALDGTLKSVNASWKRALGYELNEVVGRALFKLVDDQDRSRVIRLLNPRLVASDAAPIEIALRHKDRSYRIFAWKRRKRAGEEAMFISGKDITQKKMMETTGSLLLHDLKAQAEKMRRQEESTEDPTRKPR
jgi:PAS domain S-box-containing protein